MRLGELRQMIKGKPDGVEVVIVLREGAFSKTNAWFDKGVTTREFPSYELGMYVGADLQIGEALEDVLVIGA